MKNINKISFPVLDISINEWNIENISEIIFYDIYFHNKSYELFEELRLNHKVIDSKGNIFKIIKLQNREISWIIFFVKSKQEMIFELLEETSDLDDLKDFMLNKINNLEVNEYKFKWIEKIKKAENFRGLIRGM
ncbi:hypothetical protein [Flavobacterium pectinovorum]|uniref:Uncharacterized protein n=1 Tax=Flavobacterium pectinovorum TaxID=29533 RepID=A0A502E4K7_9FLAO|nr:hypothetical protein [Flavobacterium pectinovorum]TPG32645.1 hypothetical protein EAH81_25515 [Flavobacterium pectinovorum]